MGIEIIVQLYLAFLVVLTIHEFGHFPKKIKFKVGLFPSAVAMQSKYRLGGLVANVILFIGIWYVRPEMQFIHYVGFIAWAHFILYAIVGAIVPEKKPSQVNVKTHVFDDVPNEYALTFITLGIVAFCAFSEYYLPILEGLF